MVTVLNALTPLDWIRVAAALVLFIGPGLALLTWMPARYALDTTHKLFLAFCLSIALWAIFLAWCQWTPVRLQGGLAALFFAGGWIVVWIRRPRHWSAGRLLTRPWRVGPRLALWVVMLASAGLSLWSIQGIAVGSNLDSYHHTLIAQMIVERGGIPDDYAPYVPLATFSYHFGYHAFVAALGMLTGVRVVSLMPIAGQLLMAGMALGLAFLAEMLFASRRLALVAAALVGLASPFPAAMGSYGRYPQLLGLILGAAVVGLSFRWVRRGLRVELLPLLAILAAGLVLTHYRVALMTAVGVMLVMPVGLRANWRGRWRDWLVWGGRAVAVASCAIVLVLPWFAHVALARNAGYPLDTAPPVGDGLSFNDLARLGPWVLAHPYAVPLVALSLVAVAAALWRHQLRVVVLTLWAAALLLATGARALAGYLDMVTVSMSLFVQGAIAIGWLVTETAGYLRRLRHGMQSAVWIVLALFSLGGMSYNATAIVPVARFVERDDVDATEWIRQNVAESALFAVNLFHFPWNERSIAGSDAGGWLPLLAGRQALSLPLSAGIERVTAPDVVDKLVAIDRLRGHLATPEALQLLDGLGVTHVYIGTRGGPIALAELLASPAFRLEYRAGAAYVFSRVAPR